MAVWKEYDDWKYECFERDIDPEMLPGFEDLARLWQNRRGDRPAPVWNDFDFHDFAGWHGRILVTEVFYDPFDFRYKLFGSELVERFGIDKTGQYFTEQEDCSFDPIEDFEFHETTSRSMLITRLSGQPYWLARPHIDTIFVAFPLSDTGEMATHYLGAMV